MSEHSISEDMAEGRKNLRANPYPGRIAIMGLSENGQAILAYALMGRRPSSRNRIFVQEGTSVRTTAPDKTSAEMATAENASLIYYRAVRSDKGVNVVSNGAQTDHVFESVLAKKSLDTAVRSAPIVEGQDLSRYEPDEPNYTPRIVGVVDRREGALSSFGLAVIRKNPSHFEPIYSVYTPSILRPGLGLGVQTYKGNGDPLPSYDQDPYPYPLGVDGPDTAVRLWNDLNQENRVAVVVREIDYMTGQSAGTTIINSAS